MRANPVERASVFVNIQQCRHPITWIQISERRVEQHLLTRVTCKLHQDRSDVVISWRKVDKTPARRELQRYCTMPRTRSSPAPAPAASTHASHAPSAPATAPAQVPVPGPPGLPAPQPNRGMAEVTAPCTPCGELPCGELPCYVSVLGAPPALDINRVYTPDNPSCEVGSRLELVFRLQPSHMLIWGRSGSGCQ